MISARPPTAPLFTVFYISLGVAIVSLWLNERLRSRTKQMASTTRTRQPDDKPFSEDCY